MHEFAVAEGIIRQACEAAVRAGATRVGRLHCRIGMLRQVDEFLLREAFIELSRGTLCDGGELAVRKCGMRGTCPHCGRTYRNLGLSSESDDIVGNWTCKTCHTALTGLVGGDELELLSIEAEVHDEHQNTAEHLSEK